MDLSFTHEEIRVLGALIEKQHTTPEYYPMTLNALTNACNQKSSRNPVVAYDKHEVVRALESLREKGFTATVSEANSRVPKYKQLFVEKIALTDAEAAIMCVLMLRGPQTCGELRTHTERIYKFNDLAEVTSTIQAIMDREHVDMIIELPRQPGRKENRFAQILAGMPDLEAMQQDAPIEPETRQVRSENQRIQELETAVHELKKHVRALQEQFDQFKQQFE